MILHILLIVQEGGGDKEAIKEGSENESRDGKTEISKAFEVDVLALNNISLFRSQSHNSISNILSIVFYLGKVYEVLESFIFPSLLVVGIRDDYPYLLSWLEDIYLKTARPNG